MKKVLIVDDEPLIQYSLAKILQDSKTEVNTVNNGADAIEACRSSFYDLCFLDLALPDMIGIDLMMEIKKLSHETIILAMSASHINYYYRELIDKSAHMFIPKPFELTYIKALAQQLLEKGPNPSGSRVDASSSSAGHKSNPISERRFIDRIPYSKEITFNVNCLENIKALEQNAHIVDISKAGMGIHTACPVESGCVIRFDVLNDGANYVAGIVKNSMLIDDNTYRCGIEFV
ncbi:MAG: response regulator [Nitrospirae bacterium]|nr:response regulator [Nitrospirota bacterium]